MDFAWSAEEEELYARTVEFATRHLARDVVRADGEGEFFREGWRRAGEQGLLSVLTPEAHGGLGLGAQSAALVMEALGYGCRDMGFVFSLGAHLFACTVPIVAFGSEELKGRYLPRMGAGEIVATHCVTEPEAGSDAFAMKTKAVRRGDEYVLSGSKCFASNAPVADLFVVHAVTDPARGFLGVSSFLVERGTPGLATSNPYHKIGLRTAPLGDVFLEECVVPASNRLGAEGQGGLLFVHSMNWERACLFAGYVGFLRRQLEETIRHARTRKQFGKAIKEFQGVSHRIADMKVRLEAARLLVHRAAWQLDRSPGAGLSTDSSVAKLFVSEAAVQSSLDAIQIHGGLGIVAEGEVERYLRDAVPSRIFSGTSEIQRNTIAKNLGL